MFVIKIFDGSRLVYRFNTTRLNLKSDVKWAESLGHERIEVINLS